MCGILYTNDRSVSKEDFCDALGLMVHRGPDVPCSYGEYQGNKFGNNRLKILDLDDRGNQPFWSNDKRYVMVYNGEVYNYRELAEQYDILQKTTCDTEVLIELYAKLGPNMLELLNGMFALVILDTQTKDVFVARDRLGVKPLYYSKDKDKLTIASEISPLVELTKKTKLDEIGLRQYRKLRTFFNGHTAYSGIQMFPAGNFMFKGTLKRYWKLPEGEQSPPSDEELHELIKSAVEYRCISDVPVGSYLSGGLDSTIVAGLASKTHTWTVGFRDFNEFDWARMAAERLHSVHSEVLIDEEEFVYLAKMMVEKRKEPLSVPNEILLYKMTERVKEKNTVILSGEGADELFFGYDRIFRWAAHNPWSIEKFDELYSYGSIDDLEIVEDALMPFMHYKRPIDRVAAFFQVAHLHGLLRRLDNSTMLCSVEARVPFVDYRLVERMAGVSFEYRMENGIVKAPLKRIFRDLVPRQIIDREKTGFPVPLSSIKWGDFLGTDMDKWLEFNLNELLRCNVG